jgi:hypothetical protein
MLYKLGMRVIGKNFTGALIPWNGCEGKIVFIEEFCFSEEIDHIGVEFSIPIINYGHNCNQKAKSDCGRFFSNKDCGLTSISTYNAIIEENLIFINSLYMIEFLKL